MTTGDNPRPTHSRSRSKARGGTTEYPSSTGKVTNVPVDQSNWRKKLQTSRIKFDDEQKDIYLKHLAETGLKGASANKVGVSLLTVKNHRENDPDFMDAYEQALEDYRDRVVDHHTNLIFEGELKKRYNKDGDLVEETRTYPIRLIELELKKVDPSYREKQQIEVAHAGGVLVAPAEMTPNDWIEHQASEGEDKPRPELEKGDAAAIGTARADAPTEGKI